MTPMTDIGHGVSVMWVNDLLLWKHPGCRSWAEISLVPPYHTLEKRDPLTLSPSLLCPMDCGFHGYIKEGKWIPA